MSMVVGAITSSLYTAAAAANSINNHHHRHHVNHHPHRIVCHLYRNKIINFQTNSATSSSSSSSSGFTAFSSTIGSEVIGSSLGELSLEIREIKERCSKWQWRGHTINYLLVEQQQQQQQVVDNPNPNSSPPILLVHGFGASIAHWRRNILTLAQNHTVYAIDLLGFGGSDKPAGFSYTMESWAQLILDFLDEIVQRPTVLIGNSVGSLACVIAASGGMNNKAIVDDWRIRLLFPLFWLIDFLLNQRGIASFIFERVKQRESLRDVLLSVYANKESVDEELIEIIKEPADDEGALDAFVSIVTGPPGPNPVQLMPRITLPVLILWGDEDPFTPLDGPVGKYFSSLPSKVPNVGLCVLKGVGHCPHDDRPDLVHSKLLPWLDDLLPAL